MTIEKLLGKSSAELAALSDSDILDYFKDKLHLVRPAFKLEEAPTEKTRASTPRATRSKSKQAELAAKLAQFNKLHPEMKLEI